MSEYDEIINLPHFEPKHHPRMSSYMRAAQFSSFAALTGYNDDVAEKGRLTDERLELEEYELSQLNEKVNEVIRKQKEHPKIVITYFKGDEIKEGGAFIKKEITVRIVDEVNRFIESDKRERFMIDDIVEIE